MGVAGHDAAARTGRGVQCVSCPAGYYNNWKEHALETSTDKKKKHTKNRIAFVHSETDSTDRDLAVRNKPRRNEASIKGLRFLSFLHPNFHHNPQQLLRNSG